MLTVSLLAAVIGLAAGAIAFLLYNLIGFFTNLVFYHQLAFTFRSPQNHTLGAWVIAVPVAGGLVSGLMAKFGSRKIRGHGIPEAMEAVLVHHSRIEPRVAILKPLSAAIGIGTGGPFGAEGPIIQTGGAFGSLVGQAVRTTAAERKVLLACGAAAGMAATFSTPIAAVILAIELLLFEFKSRSFIPLVIASTLATSVHIRLLGPGPMFEAGVHDFGIPHALPFYLLFGIICGLAAVGLSKALYWVEDWFEKLPLDEVWQPALGMLAVGIIGYFVPRVLGVGYDSISDVLTNRLTLTVLLLLLVFKTLALLLSLGSGTSGGLLAPTFLCSASLGAVYAMAVNRLFPGAQLAPAAFALVAMGAVFGAASRATFAFIIFAFEITRDYNAVLPLMLVAVIADGVAILLSKNSIMTERLARRGVRIHQEYEPDVLHQVTVGETMNPDVPGIPATMTVRELADTMAGGHPLARHYALPILDPEGRLAGIITRGDVVEALEEAPEGGTTVLQAGTQALVVTHPDELLAEAVGRMLHHDIGRLLVVSRDEPHKLLGYLGRAGVMSARMRRHQEEHVREPGWLGRMGSRD